MKTAAQPGVAGVVILMLQAAPAAQAGTLPERLGACAAITDSATRLACFDGLAADVVRTDVRSAAPVAAAAGGEVAAAAAATPPVAAGPVISPEQSFGREQALFTQSVSGAKSLREISATITTVRAAKDGRLTLELDNGQVWHQTEIPAQQFSLRPGDAVTIRRGALNSFVLLAPDQRSTRVRRVR